MPIVYDWLARRAALSPERAALIDALRGDRRISWRQWNASANRTARLLQDMLGVSRGDRVAVLAMNCMEYLDLLFACAKLGAILQPLNWRLSSTELYGLFADAEPVVFVHGSDFQSQVQAVRPHARSRAPLRPLDGVLRRPARRRALRRRDSLSDAPLPPST